jgi:RHS repeat-associated protein
MELASGQALESQDTFEVQTCYNVASNCSGSNVNSSFSTVVTTTNLNGTQVSSETQDYTGPELLSSDSISGLSTTTYTYNTYAGPNSVSLYRVASVIRSAGGTNYQETTYGYDETTPSTFSGTPLPAAVTTERGNLTSVHQWINSSGTALSTTNTYDTTGTVQTSTGPTGTTTLGHDATGTFTTSVTPPTPSSGVTLTNSITYDPNTGLPTLATDPNGAQATYKYTGMLMPKEVDSLDSSSNLVAKTLYSFETVNQNGILTFQSATTNADTEPLLDGYGRLSRVAVANGQSGNPYYQQDSCYDANGRLSFQSYSYQGAGWGTAKVCSGAGDTYSYDALGRVTRVTHGDGTYITYTYNGRAVQMTDENGVSRISQVDGLGRLSAVCEISSSTLQGVAAGACNTSAGAALDIAGTGFNTWYAYNLSSHTTTVSQGAQTRTFQTDWIGRPTLVQEPESGQTVYSYAYNSTGLAVTRTKPRANQTNSSVVTTATTQYDSVGRPTTISYSDGTPTKNFEYDVSTGWGPQTNFKGRLATAYVAGSSPATSSFSYDAVGRIIALGQCTPSTCGVSGYGVSETYDLAGNLTTSTSADAVVTTYAYSRANEVQSIQSSLNDANHPPNLMSGISNGPFGPLNYQLGNGTEQLFQYDTLGRPANEFLCIGSLQTSCNGGTQLYGHTQTWAGHRVYGECDTGIAKCYDPAYDEFDRMTAINVYSGVVQNFTYTYDRYGNRWSQSAPQGGGTFSASYNAATNQIIPTGPDAEYAYDAAGNMTNDGYHSYTYDAEGNITQVDAGSTAIYTYNALNQRVRIDKGSSAYEFVVNPNGKRDTVWDGHSHAELRHQYYWGTAPFAWYDGYTHFQTLDYMGTARIQTSETGTVEGVYSFLPWGDSLSGAGNGSDAYSGGAAVNDAYHFAGLDHDYETDTDHAQFRQYSPAQGRWLSPDPYGGSYDPTNPQSLNRFSYVLNNPLTFTDPLGLESAVGGSGCGNDPNCSEPGASGSGSGGGGCQPGDASCGTGIGSDPFFGNVFGGMLGSLANAEEAEWLGSGNIPWYSVQGGDLWLSWGSPSGIDPVTGAITAGTNTLNLGTIGGISSGTSGGFYLFLGSLGAGGGGPGKGRPEATNPILKYDQCATQVKNEAKQKKWTINIFQAVTFGNTLAACALTGPDAPFCVGIVSGLNLVVSGVNFMSAQKYIYDGETQCLQHP